MNKHARMEAFVAGLGGDPALAAHPCYQGYFQCFNDARYYEAHDVLEHLWLRGGRADPEHAFYKGLIQVAGAFVHLQKQHARPATPRTAGGCVPPCVFSPWPPPTSRPTVRATSI